MSFVLMKQTCVLRIPVVIAENGHAAALTRSVCTDPGGRSLHPKTKPRKGVHQLNDCDCKSAIH